MINVILESLYDGRLTPWTPSTAKQEYREKCKAVAEARQRAAEALDGGRSPTLANPYEQFDPSDAMGRRGGKGRKDDSDKVPLELLPMDALIAIAHVLRFGAQKYQARNWEKGIKWGRVFGATLRHLFAWWQGKTPTDVNYVLGSVDSETKMSHLWHAGCCILFLIAYEARGMTEFDDRPGT